MTDTNKDPGYTPEAREISEVKQEATGLSGEILRAIGLQGEVSKPGPGVAVCGEENADRFYTIHHPWSLTGVPIGDMKKAMTRLKEELPKNGWKIVSYGPDKSPSKSLELVADSTKRKFSVNIHLYDETVRAKTDGPKSKIYVDLISACFQVPKGKTVDQY
ncbi:hypothetical protein EST92_08315 [Streptomyces sp. TM32]|uniref:hypothetical protein n=1 Tax=Streptomyces sp. TM32 TaxID=1652669 RepID=UPI0010125642|nr:hypothetical protein [Streptomyces sp. TM32]RXS85332.1 hypothetical protein EST92_08315 [Streptomyces sp. TM32]